MITDSLLDRDAIENFSLLNYFKKEELTKALENKVDRVVHHTLNHEAHSQTPINFTLSHYHAQFNLTAPPPLNIFGELWWQTLCRFDPQAHIPSAMLPLSCLKEANRSCPFWKEKNISETHSFIWCPATLFDQALDLKKLLNSVEKERRILLDPMISANCLLKKNKESHWIGITKNYVPMDLLKSEMDQYLIPVGYRLPTMMEALISLLAYPILGPGKQDLYLICSDHVYQEPILVGINREKMCIEITSYSKLSNGRVWVLVKEFV